MRVYLLCDYEEHGPEHLCGTSDVSQLLVMLDARLDFRYEKDNEEARASLREFIAEGKAGGRNLNRGWGGWQVHAVDLE